jgi:hypothetical protein
MRPCIATIRAKTGSKIRDTKGPVRRQEFGRENIRIRQIFLRRLKIVNWTNLKMAAFFFVEQRAKQERAVKARPTHPSDVRLVIDMCKILAIANQPHFVFVL